MFCDRVRRLWLLQLCRLKSAHNLSMRGIPFSRICRSYSCRFAGLCTGACCFPLLRLTAEFGDKRFRRFRERKGLPPSTCRNSDSEFSDDSIGRSFFQSKRCPSSDLPVFLGWISHNKALG